MSQISIRKVYLYLFSLIGLVLVTIGCVQLVGLFLKTYIFTKADVYYEYPMARPVKPAPAPDGGATKEEVQQPSKEEIEKFQNDQRSSQRQRDAAEALAMILVGLPLYWYHWRKIKDEKEIT